VPKEYILPLCLKKVDFNAGTLEYIHVSKELIVTLINFDEDNPMYAMLDIDRFDTQVHGHVIQRCDKTCKIEDFNALLEKAKQMIPPIKGLEDVESKADS
jgi:hypothetical protein